MKKLTLLSVVLACSACFSIGHAAVSGVQLELNNTLGVDTEVVPPNTTFTLDIDVQDLTGTQSLSGFDITLMSLPTGITFDGYAQVLTNFTVNQDTGLYYSAASGSSADDITIGSGQTTILEATFTTTSALTLGNNTIDFAAEGTNPTTRTSQDLIASNGSFISYTDDPNTVVGGSGTVPEPSQTALLFSGLAVLGAGFFLRRRLLSA